MSGEESRDALAAIRSSRLLPVLRVPSGDLVERVRAALSPREAAAPLRDPPGPLEGGARA